VDCGFQKEKKSNEKLKSMLAELRHFSRIDYERWRLLGNKILSGSLDNYFLEELMLNNEELKMMKDKFGEALNLLESNRNSGLLLLDPDLESYLGGKK
jgi:hypothetical protein